MLFEDELLNIKTLNNVIYYKPKHLAKYKGKLPTYELMYYIEGESTVSFNGKKYEISSNNVLFLPKGIENDDYSINIKKPVKLYNIYFDTDNVLPDHPVVIPVKSAEISGLFEKLFRAWISKKDGYYYKSMGYIYHIAEKLKKIQPNYSTKKSFNYLIASEEYMASHYCDYKFNIDEFVRLSGLSYSYFKKLFIEKYGIPPKKYINRLKINRACELLNTGSFTVGEIAEICGFENTYYFSNVFKDHIGVSPKKYKSIT